MRSKISFKNFELCAQLPNQSATNLRTPNAVYVREKQSEPPCAGTKLATVNSAVLQNATLHHAAPIQYLRYRYSVSSGAASTHGLNTVTRAFSKSLASRETIVKP
jgi:hypothetical protein